MSVRYRSFTLRSVLAPLTSLFPRFPLLCHPPDDSYHATLWRMSSHADHLASPSSRTSSGAQTLTKLVDLKGHEGRIKGSVQVQAADTTGGEAQMLCPKA